MLTNRMSWLVQAYVWQPAGSGDFDVPLWMKADSNVYTYVTDGNKNIRQLKNAAGTVVATYDYDPFGNVSATGSVSSNPWQFSSEFHDIETGLIYYNYRYYAPTIGRWISRDPIWENSGVNLYAMVSNHVINKSDYYGLILFLVPEAGFLEEYVRGHHDYIASGGLNFFDNILNFLLF